MLMEQLKAMAADLKAAYDEQAELTEQKWLLEDRIGQAMIRQSTMRAKIIAALGQEDAAHFLDILKAQTKRREEFRG